jgi:hypothetical protein
MDEDVVIAFMLPAMLAVVAIGVPLVRALARRWERQDALRAASPDPDRLARIEQAIDAMAVEVERISEGQRFVTKVLAEREERVALPRGGQDRT